MRLRPVQPVAELGFQAVTAEQRVFLDHRWAGVDGLVEVAMARVQAVVLHCGRGVSGQDPDGMQGQRPSLPGW
jgi:hypothetical protein